MEQESKSEFAVVKLRAQKSSGTELGCISTDTSAGILDALEGFLAS